MQDYSKLAADSDILRKEIKIFEYRVSWSCSATKNINICPFLNLITALNLEVKILFGKLTSGHRTGKGQFSFQSLRKAMPECTTTTQLHSSHILATWCSKFSKPWIVYFNKPLQQHMNSVLQQATSTAHE